MADKASLEFGASVAKARLLASVPPLVNMIWAAGASINAATCSLAVFDGASDDSTVTI